MLEFKNIFNKKLLFFYLIANIIIIKLSNNYIFNSLLLIYIYILLSINIFSNKKIKKKFIDKRKNIKKKIKIIKKKIYFLKYEFPNIYIDLIKILDNYYKLYQDIKYTKKNKLFDKKVKNYYKYHKNRLDTHTINTFTNIKFSDYNKYVEIEKDLRKIIYKILNIF